MTEEQKEKLPGVTEIFLGLRVYTGFPGNVRKLGYILDKEEEAEEFANWYDGWTNEIKSRAEKLSEDEKPRVFLSSFYKYMGDYSTVGTENRHAQMCDIAGGRNIAADLPYKGGWPKVDPEWVITKNPEIIIMSGNTISLSSGYDTDDPSEMAALREDFLNRPELANVAAVKNGKVYIYASWGAGCLGSGPCCPIGTAYMAKWFHPELFEDLDPREIHQEYLDRFQRIDFNVYEHGVFVYPPLDD
jgi:iron complex transport system substrate-binding protein